MPHAPSERHREEECRIPGRQSKSRVGRFGPLYASGQSFQGNSGGLATGSTDWGCGIGQEGHAGSWCCLTVRPCPSSCHLYLSFSFVPSGPAPPPQLPWVRLSWQTGQSPRPGTGWGWGSVVLRLGFPREVCVNSGAVGTGPSKWREIGEVWHNWPLGRSRGLEMATSGDSCCRELPA